jgi:hypothetical protein
MVSKRQQALIADCTDAEQLRKWVTRAATVTKVDDLFD